MDKKKIVFGIVIFLLLALIVFSFANPNEDIDKDGSGYVSQEEGEKKNSDLGSSEDTEIQDNNEALASNENDNVATSDQNNNSGVGRNAAVRRTNANNTTNNNVNNEGGSAFVNNDNNLDNNGDSNTSNDNNKQDDLLKKAKEATEKAEQTLDKEDVKDARDLVNKLDDGTNKTDLNNRLDELDKIIKIKEILDKLEQEIKDAKDKNNIIETLKERNESEVERLIKELNDSVIKDELQDRLDKIDAVLNDNEIIISGVTDGEYTNKDKVTINTEEKLKVYVNGQLYDGKLEFTEEGTYTVKFIDDSYNELEITFTIDRTNAVIIPVNILISGESNDKTIYYAKKGNEIWTYIRSNEILKVNPTFKLINNNKEYEVSDVRVTGPNDKGEYTYSAFYKIEENTQFADGEITLNISNIMDMAGNVSKVITKPTNGHIVIYDVNGPENATVSYSPDSKTNKNVTVTISADEVLQELEGWELSEDGKSLSKEFSENEKGTVTIKDLAGNEANINYDVNSIDRQAPRFFSSNLLVIGDPNEQTEFYATNGDTIYADLKVNEELKTPTFTLKNNGKNYKVDDVYFSGPDKDGKYVYSIKYKITDKIDMDNGQITLTISNIMDLAGNKIENVEKPSNSHELYLDRKDPVIKVKTDEDYTTGSIDEKIYKMVSFKLSDNEKVDKIYVNGYEKDLTDAKYSDLNYVVPGKSGAIEGENEIKLVDVSGNETSYKFTLDVTAPAVTVENTPNHLTNSKVIVKVNANERLQEIDGWKLSDDKKVLSKEFKDNTTGNVTVKDIAGNETLVNYTVDNIDKASPVIEVKDGENYTIGSKEDNVYKMVSFKLSDNKRIDKIYVNGKEKDLTNAMYGDHDFVVPGMFGAIEGENEIKLADEAGNETSYKFTLDTTLPVINLNGLNNIRIEKGKEEYKEEGATVTDNFDKIKKDVKPSKIEFDDGSKIQTVKSVDNEKVGKYYLTYTAKDSAGNDAVNVIRTVEVYYIPVEDLEINVSELVLTEDESSKITVTVKPDNSTNKDVEFKSLDEKIAKVDENGKVTGVKAGKTTIVITTKDGVTKNITVNVKPKEVLVENIKVKVNKETLNPGKTATATAIIEPSNATTKDVTWTSSNPKVATVDENGKITAIKEGTVKITAKANDDSNTSGSATIEVINTATWEKSAKINAYVHKLGTSKENKTVNFKFVVKEINKITKNGDVKVKLTNENGYSKTITMKDGVAEFLLEQSNEGKYYKAIPENNNLVSYKVEISIVNDGGKKVTSSKELYVTTVYSDNPNLARLGLPLTKTFTTAGNGHYFYLPEFSVID